MKICLIRILGNDLPPRHDAGQTLANLRFTLANEPDHPGVVKHWILNRIVDPAVADALSAAIRQRGHLLSIIPFRPARYRACWTDQGTLDAALLPGTPQFRAQSAMFRHRAQDYLRRAFNLYLMNNNGARNAALAIGREAGADWVLPWDGGTFLTRTGFEAIRAAMDDPAAAYLIVPMHRARDDARLLEPDFTPDADDEPQIAFGRSARESFDPALRYGSKPKAQLLARLGVPGPWQNWLGVPRWESIDDSPSPQAGAWRIAGWVARLTGGTERDPAGTALWLSRFAGIDAFTRGVAQRLIRDSLAKRPAVMFAALGTATARTETPTPSAGRVAPALPDGLRTAIAVAALTARSMAPVSVVDKTLPPAGGDRHDYHSPAPYWHMVDGRMTRRDGVTRPDAVLYSEASDAFDRSRFQRLIDASCALALQHRLAGCEDSGRHAAMLVRRWFLDPATAMRPLAPHAQALADAPAGRVWSGIVDFRDLPSLLDAIRLLVDAGLLSRGEQAALSDWLRRFLFWLLRSPQGRSAAGSRNNLATWHRAVTLALALHLGEAAIAADIVDCLPLMLRAQFTADGEQPHEARRREPVHYALFNLQAWAGIAQSCRALGRDLWSLRESGGRSLGIAMRALSAGVRASGESGHAQRFEVLRALSGIAGPSPDLPACFPPETGIPPFWQLGVSAGGDRLRTDRRTMRDDGLRPQDMNGQLP